MGHLQNEEHQLGELDVLLLNNLTRLEEGSRQLLQVGESLEGFYLEKLVEILVSKRGDEKKDPYAWVARVLMNVSQLPEARKILLDEKRDIFKDLLKDIQHRNPIRKRAVLGAIKYRHLHSLTHPLTNSLRNAIIIQELLLRAEEARLVAGRGQGEHLALPPLSPGRTRAAQ